MKTLDITPANDVTTRHARVRLLLTIAGVATAVLCSFALQHEAPRTKGLNAEVFQLQKVSNLLTKDFIGEVQAWM